MKTFFFCVIFIVLSIINNVLDHKIRTFAQKNKTLHEIIMTTDLCSFAMNGGDPLNYNNYYKWTYAKWINDEKRTTFEKIIFWKTGFFYDASNPPREYRYPLLIQ